MAGSMLAEEMVTGSPHKIRYLELQWLAIIFPLKIAIWWVYPISVTAQIISSWLVIYTVYIYISHRDIPIKSIPIMVGHPMKNPHFVKPPLPGPWPAAPSGANFGPGSASAASGERAVGTPGGYEALLGWRYRCNIVFVDIRAFPKSWGYPQTIQVIAYYQWEQLWFGVPTIWKECRIRSIIVLL